MGISSSFSNSQRWNTWKTRFEIIENNKSSAPKLFISQGSSRINTFTYAMVPETFSRMLIYYFYRWETCVRESTVLVCWVSHP